MISWEKQVFCVVLHCFGGGLLIFWSTAAVEVCGTFHVVLGRSVCAQWWDADLKKKIPALSAIGATILRGL